MAEFHDEYAEIAEFYDHIIPYRERRDLEFYVSMAEEAEGPVLEVACGTGRVLIPTARAGQEIVGLDASEAMLAICRSALAREDVEVRNRVSLHQADMRDFNLNREFGLITIPFRPFQHLHSVEDQIACLRTIHRHLAPGGRFILDIFDPILERLISHDFEDFFETEPEFTMSDGRKVIRRGRGRARDLPNQLLDIDLVMEITHPDGRKEELVQSVTLRYFFRYEAEHLLARCGFAVEDVFCDYDRSPFGEKSPGELIFVARKA